MGAEIVQQVVRDLIPLGLENASSFLLTGSSAGGTGVMLNLDRIYNLVHHELGTSRGPTRQFGLPPMSRSRRRAESRY